MDDTKSVLISDDFPGGEAAMDVFDNRVQRVLCTYHQTQNINGKLGAKDAAIALEALNAKTPEQLSACKLQFNAKTERYMGQRTDKERYPCLTPELGYRQSSQGAESANAANREFRAAPFGDALTIAKLMTRRFTANKDQALKCSEPLPPMILKEHRLQHKYSALVSPENVTWVTNSSALV